jgi:hypothetical protein
LKNRCSRKGRRDASGVSLLRHRAVGQRPALDDGALDPLRGQALLRERR